MTVDHGLEPVPERAKPIPPSTKGRKFRLYAEGDFFLVEQLPPDFNTLQLMSIGDRPAQAGNQKDLVSMVRKGGSELHNKKLMIVKILRMIEVTVQETPKVQLMEKRKTEIKVS